MIYICALYRRICSTAFVTDDTDDESVQMITITLTVARMLQDRELSK